MTGQFIYVTAARLTQMESDAAAAIAAIQSGLQSYSLAGRTFTRANFKDLVDYYAEVTYALAWQAGTIQNFVYPDFSGGNGGGGLAGNFNDR